MLVSSIHLVMIVTGFLLSMMFIVFVCTRLICARIQMNASTGPFPTASRSNVGRQEHGFHGLEPIFVATFPTKKFSDDFFSSGEDSQCTVCLAEYQERDILRILPYCGHFFHVSCIDTWLQQHSTCPVCRISLCDRKHQMQPMLSSVVRSYNMDSTDPYSYNWSITGHGYSSRTINNQSMVPAAEDQSASELDAAEIGESTSSAEDNNSQVGKDKDFHDSQTSMSRVHPLSINQ